jgi:hypothetical protein
MSVRGRAQAAGASLAGALIALVCAGLAGPARAADGERGLRVEYQVSRVSVEARDVSLGSVLAAIGVKVGFTVVDSALSPTVVTVSIKDASVEEALRQLLRGENYTMIYAARGDTASASGPAIDKIVLLGEPGRLQAIADPWARRPGDDRPADVPVGRNVVSVGASPAAAASPAAPPPMPLATMEPSPAGEIASGAEGHPVTVGDLLRAHAMVAAQGAQQAIQAGPSASSANLEALLAETTRRAQHSLNALIEGLAAATRSMSQPAPATRP